MKRILICILICMLLSVPLTSGRVIVNDEPADMGSNGGLIDNVFIRCDGTYLTSIPWILLGFNVNFVVIKISNSNDIAITYELSLEVVTRDGRELGRFNDVFKLNSNTMVAYTMLHRYDWEYIFGYRFGFFDMIIGVTIRDDGSHEKLVFHCFNYGFGALIFNPSGKKIE